MTKEIVVEVPRSDLVFLRRSIDDAIAELAAAVADGLVDESVLGALDESYHMLDGYLK